MRKKLWTLIEHWLTIKIGVEVRCCLSFLLILFFYCMYRLLSGITEANIWHIAEMIGVAYIFGWVQALLHADYDEMDRLGPKEWAVIVSNGIVYGLTAWLGGWFDGNIAITLFFLLYMIVCALCTLLIYYIKRSIDAKLLNDDLKEFQRRSED